MMKKLLPIFFTPLIIFFILQYKPMLVVISTASMKPTLNPGDLVITLTPTDIKVGDIIMYRKIVPFSSVQLIVHRVVDIKDGIIKTKGDANIKEDSWDVTKNEVLGKVHLVIPYMGHFLNFVRNNLMTIVLITTGLGLFLLSRK